MDAAKSPQVQGLEPTFSTRSLRYWGAAVSQGILPLDAHQVGADDQFFGQVSVARFHHCVVADVHSSAHRVLRTRSLAVKDDVRHLKVIWQLNGRTQLEHLEGISLISAGQWAVYDTSRPYKFEMSDDNHFQMLLLPITNASTWAWCAEHLMGQALPGDGTAEVARAAMSGLFTGNVKLDSQGQSVLQESVLALMGSALNQIAQATDGAKKAISKKLQIAQHFIEQNFTAPSLSPDEIAHACGMSRRSLYSAFSSVGLTPQAYIMQRRLATACDMLNEYGSQRTITQMAYELGFADAAHFSRTFSACYGVTASQWRNKRRQ